MTMEIETAARRMLLADSAVRGYVVDKVFRHRLEQKVDGTGSRAIVVSRQAGWATPRPHSRVEFPVLQVDFYADVDRDAAGLVVAANAEDKAFAMFRAADPLLNGVRDEVWGATDSNAGLRIHVCDRWTEPLVISQADQHGVSTLGDSVYVTVRYAVETAH